MKKLLSVLSISYILVLLSGTAYAVEYGGVGANPANPDPSNPRTQSIFVYNLDPGAEKQDAVRIVNSSDSEKTIAVDVVDSEASSGGALACKQTVEPKKEVGSWVRLQKTQVTLAAHKTETVPFTLTVPKSASVGEHNGCVVVQDITASPLKTGQNGVSLSFRSALRMAVTVKGNVYSNISFLSVSRSIKGSTEIIHPYVKNDGNVSVDSNIHVSLTNILGHTVSSASGDYPILAHTTADWNFELKRPFWGGFYKVNASANYPADPTKPLGVTQSDRKIASGPSHWIWVTPAPTALLIEILVIALVTSAIAWWLYRRMVVSKWEKHKITEHDTLQSLAKSHNVNWRLVARVNKIRAPYQLEAGKWISLPKK